ncbi:MAG: COX15/CtaA family protein [Gemmatimonadales bacterium]|jgi:heme A synthase
MRTLRLLSFVTAGFAYAIIVLGFVVRITGSGMGCGDDWPLCNGALIPAFDEIETVIEYAHRLAVLGLGALALVVAFVAYSQRTDYGGSGPGGTLRPAGLVLLLLVAQSLLGALTVKLELPPWTVVLHLGAGLGLLATLFVLGLRAGVHSGISPAPPGTTVGRGGIMGALVLTALVVLLGGMTATTGAFTACQGFPLCNGRIWPESGGGGLAHIHWTHRLLAYGLFFHLLGMAVALRRKRAPGRLQGAGWTAFVIAAAQVAVGAVMVLTGVQPAWRAVHAALGTAVWVVVVYLTWLAASRLKGPERGVATEAAGTV